jgi:F-type H+-transporting ATPase subunit b
MLDFSVTFIITIINITILFLILRKILFKPVTKFMADRAKRVQDIFDQAARDKAGAQELLERYREKTKNADAEAAEIIAAAKKKAIIESEKIIADGRAAVEVLTAAAQRQLDAEREAMFTRFRLEAAALVMTVSARLLERELSSDDNRRYAAMLMDELAAQKGNI